MQTSIAHRVKTIVIDTKTFIMLIVVVLVAAQVRATTYYVDFAGGNDVARGDTPEAAWKHAPGDPNAEATPAAVERQPGDVMKFKGGVRYRGEILLRVSGTPARPIVLDGNTAGDFGEGRAVFDGSRRVVGWRRVSSASQVGGNPRWGQIWFADLDVDLSRNFGQDRFVLHRVSKADVQAPWQRLFLVDGERHVLPVAQRPKPTDPFFPDLPQDFYESPEPLTDTYPHQIAYEEGTRGNRSLPLLGITRGGAAPVIQPLNGGRFSVTMDRPHPVAEIGIKLHRPKTTPAPEQVVFFIDDEPAHVARIDSDQEAMQRFRLDRPVDGRRLTFELRHRGEDVAPWTKIEQVAAFTPDSKNLIRHDIDSLLTDAQRLTQQDPRWYDGMFVGVHGGNNHVYFAAVRRYVPSASRLVLPHFAARVLDKTRWAIYNAPKLIDLPGEWCVVPLDGGRSRVFLRPREVRDGQPIDIGYPELGTAVQIVGDASHLEVRGFLIQRYAGGRGGIATVARGRQRPSHIRIADCEVRFSSGQAGVAFNHSDHVTLENCYIHHNPGWTVGVYVNRVNHFRLLNNRIDTNAGSGIRHYESKHGEVRGNHVLGHYGMHASGINLYEGCHDVLVADNYIENVVAINRNASELVLRNNVVDSQNRGAFGIAVWKSGRTGGRDIRDLTLENNTLVNPSDAGYATSIFVQRGASPPTGMVVRENVLDRLRDAIPGEVNGNVFLTVGPEDAGVSVSRPGVFRDPDGRDYRRRPGGPHAGAGADVAPPPAAWGGHEPAASRP
ncbi:MAG: right-handed parallel beta-helix repeat-containing protein [Planctomycetota bacterium]